VASTAPGTTLQLGILRDGQPRDISVTIGALDNPLARARNESKGEEAAAGVGIEVESLTPELAQRFGYEKESGVLIARVEEGSPAERAGLQPGHLITSVNRQPVRNLADFRKALAGSNPKNGVVFLVTDGNFSRFVALSLD
jgi:serine protease Do